MGIEEYPRISSDSKDIERYSAISWDIPGYRNDSSVRPQTGFLSKLGESWKSWTIMEEISMKENHEGGIMCRGRMKKEGWNKKHGGGILEEESCRRNHAGGTQRRNHGGGTMEDESWRRNHGGGNMEEQSCRRNHGGAIMEEQSWRSNHG